MGWMRSLLCLLLLFVLVPAGVGVAQASSQRPGLSAELGLGLGTAGGGASFSGKAAARLHSPSGRWAVGIRAFGADGERRRKPDCSLFCEPIESVTEGAVLLYRTFLAPVGDARWYLGGGVGRVSGRRFVGTSAEVEDVSEVGLSWEVAIHAPRSGFRFVVSAIGHIGSGGPLWGGMLGIAFGR